MASPSKFPMISASLSLSLPRLGWKSTSTPRSLKICTAAGDSASEMRTFGAMDLSFVFSVRRETAPNGGEPAPSAQPPEHLRIGFVLALALATRLDRHAVILQQRHAHIAAGRKVLRVGLAPAVIAVGMENDVRID